jgi:hypothetical protein
MNFRQHTGILCPNLISHQHELPNRPIHKPAHVTTTNPKNGVFLKSQPTTQRMYETLTWNDVLNKLKQLTPEQLEMPACILDMNNDDRDNILIADPHGYFLENTPALFFDSGHGYEFDRKSYYKEEYKDEYDEDEYVWEDVTLIVRNKELTLSQEQYWDKSVGQLFEENRLYFSEYDVSTEMFVIDNYRVDATTRVRPGETVMGIDLT